MVKVRSWEETSLCRVKYYDNSRTKFGLFMNIGEKESSPVRCNEKWYQSLGGKRLS